jgi:putative Holliday junction resolvase
MLVSSVYISVQHKYIALKKNFRPKYLNLHNLINYVNILARILALDYGEKRTGIAITDELQIIASGLTTVETKNIFSFLTDYLKKEKVELFLVGEPKQMNNIESESEQFIRPFVEKLSQTFPKIPIKRVDERFTSKMAVQSMIDSGLKKKQRQNKSLIDEISATIILQTYLYSGKK